VAAPPDSPDPRSAKRPPRKPGRPRAETRTAALREALLDAATELAIERGFESVGLREIAQRAGASPGMIAYYFGDRDGLYESLFERAFARMADRVVALLTSDDAKDTDLDELTQLHVTALSRDPWIPQLIAREVLAKQTHFRDVFAKRVSEGPMRAMKGWIESEIAAGRLRSDLDPQLTAMSIAALAIFPYLFGPIIGPSVGLQLDESLRDRLIEHNRLFVSRGIRAHPERSS
jgi:AcrR family transcriptional regulator